MIEFILTSLAFLAAVILAAWIVSTALDIYEDIQRSKK